jgi:hypothetical protein
MVFLLQCVWGKELREMVQELIPRNFAPNHFPLPLLYSTVLEFKQSMGFRNRVGIGLAYRLARLQSLAELVPWNRFLGSLKF